MSKVQQQHGLQTNPLNSSVSSGLASTTSLSSTANVSNNATLSASETGSVLYTSYDSGLVKTMESSEVPSVNESKKNQEILKQNEQKQKMIKKRRNIITEIIQTEKSYVQDLKACLESYVNQFINNKAAQPEYLKDKEAIIFGNLEDIYNFHKK